MNRKFLAVAAAAFALGGNASAATFTFGLLGTIESGSPPGCGLGPSCTVTTSPWTGTLTIETEGTADGDYSGATLGPLTYSTGLVDYARPADTDNSLWDIAIVTLSHGAPVSLDIHYVTDFADVFSVGGMTANFAHYDPRAGEPGGLPLMAATGTLTLVSSVSGVPEPTSAVLLLAGLALVGFRAGRGGSPSPARSPWLA